MSSVDGPEPTRPLSRPRTAIPRIKRLFSTKTVTVQASRPSSQSLRNAIPTEIITKVGQHLPSLVDVLSVSLTCRRARKALLCRLYTTVELKTNRHCKVTLTALSGRPEHTQHIKCLIVRPNCVERTSAGELMEETSVVNLIVKIASRMPQLRSFYWDGLEMPDDKLWLALRQFCPYLRSVGSSVGYLPIRSSDHLFDFRDLIKFSLVVRSDSLDWLPDGRPGVEKLPRRCWEMLLERCSNLEELTIGGPAPSPRLFDTRHITAGRWPRLRKLTLGDMRLQPLNDQDEKGHEMLCNFLIVHPHLQDVSFLQPGGSGFPPCLMLPRFALPKMHSFSGPSRYVRCLPHPSLIEHLSITTLHHCPSAFPQTHAILKTLPSLTSLTIWIDLSFAQGMSIHDDTAIFRGILECCPLLLHFEVFCFTRATFHIKDFSKALSISPQLRSFSLTKMYKSSDEDMSHAAFRIVRDNPHIQTFTLRFTEESWLTHTAGPVKQQGEYEVLADVDGLPRNILAYEWKRKSFGQLSSRRYLHPLNASESRRSSSSSRLSWSSAERSFSPRPLSVLSFNSFQFNIR